MMDKTININIADTLFQIDEEAYQILRDYLQAINNRFRNEKGGNETIEDIESRIAEIFLSQRVLAGVITKENVEAMISIIGKPEDFEQSEFEAESTSYNEPRKRMYRNPDDSIISGVCGGIGAYLNTDPVLFRILFVIFTVFFGVGFFVYIALWIALPSANSDTKKREMYGNSYQSARSQIRQPDGTYTTGVPSYNKGYYTTSRIGNAFNEVFRAIGRVLFIALRIFLIIIGISFVLLGFLAILSFVMIFLFKYPGGISPEALGTTLTNFPIFLNYVVTPAATPWIIALTTVAFALPMLALIYWGVKMIFWFKAKDGYFSLGGLVLWVMTLAALAMILASEGISFAERGKISSQRIITPSPDTLYIRTVNKISELKFDEEFLLSDNGYKVFINKEKKELYITPYLNINSSYNDTTIIEVKKRSQGRTEEEAMKKTEGLLYNYSLNGDTLSLDDYFTIPSGSKWTNDNISINLDIPEGTILKIDSSSEKLLHSTHFEFKECAYPAIGKSGFRSWVLTEDGLEPAIKGAQKQK